MNSPASRSEVFSRFPELKGKTYDEVVYIHKAHTSRLADLQERFKRGDLTERQFRAKVATWNREKSDILYILEKFPPEEIFKRTSVCSEELTPTSANRNLLQHPTPETRIPETHPQKPFLSPLREENPLAFEEVRPEIESPVNPVPPINEMENNNIPAIWKEVPKFVCPITGNEDIDSMESKLKSCQRYATKYNLELDDYTEALKEVSTEKFLNFLNHELPAVLPIYENVNPAARRILSATLARFDRPTHEYAAQIQNPMINEKESVLKFLSRLRVAGTRSAFPLDQQPRVQLIRALRHVPELQSILQAQPLPAMQDMITSCINVLVRMGDKIEDSENIPPIQQSTQQRRDKLMTARCAFCNRQGHDERNCWSKHPEKKPTNGQLLQLFQEFSFAETEDSTEERDFRNACRRLLRQQNITNSARGHNKHLMEELFKSFLKARSSISVKRMLPLLLNDPRMMTAMLNQYYPDESASTNSTASETSGDREIARQGREAAIRMRQERRLADAKAKAKAKSESSRGRQTGGAGRGTTSTEYAQAQPFQPRQGLRSCSPTIANPNVIDDLLSGSPNTQPTGNFMRNLFSQLLTDSFCEGGEIDDIEDDEFDYDEINDLSSHMMIMNDDESSIQKDYSVNLDVLPTISLETDAIQVQALNPSINKINR